MTASRDAQGEAAAEAPRAAEHPGCALVIFGGAGDLARRKLIPGLWNLALDRDLPEDVCIIGYARTDLDDEKYRALAREGVERHSRRPIDEAAVAGVRARHLLGARDLRRRPRPTPRSVRGSTRSRPSAGSAGNRIFYLSIAPSLDRAVRRAPQWRRARDARGRWPWSRVIIEKPIGHDLASARAINRQGGRGLRRAARSTASITTSARRPCRTSW